MPEDVFEIVGTVVGGAYSVEEVVAEGGFAVVYRARHGAFRAPIALKCLKVSTVGRATRDAFLEQFREEGEVLFRLSQSIPTVVRPLHVDAFETASGTFVPYMALEWLEGDSLDQIIVRRALEGRPPLSVKRVVRMLAPVARALVRAHNFPGPTGPVSILHRDLKPDNIVLATVNGEEVVKILDFGIAKVKSVATQAVGRMSQDASAVPFTPGYAAPEQWFPKRYGQTGPWTDVWGLALTTTETICGRPIIDGDHAAMIGTAVDETRRPTPRSEGADVSDAVDAVFTKALAVDPRERYQEVATFWDALEDAIGLPRSSHAGVGVSPQPYSDGRSDGPPAGLEERVSVPLRIKEARPSPALAAETLAELPPVLGVFGLEEEEAADSDGAGQEADLRPVYEVPDLEPAPSRARRSIPAQDDGTPDSVSEADLDDRPMTTDQLEFDPAKALGRPSSPRVESIAPTELESEPPPAGVGTNASAVPATGGPAAPPAPTQVAPSAPPATSPTRVAPPPPPSVLPATKDKGIVRGLDAQVGTQPTSGRDMLSSGLDLAVSPDELRRSADRNVRIESSDRLPSVPGGPASTVAAKVSSTPPAVQSGAYAPLPEVPKPPPGPPSMVRKLILPIALASVGMILAFAYYINASIGGGRWSLGPVPVNWIAGLLAVVGCAILLVRLFWPLED